MLISALCDYYDVLESKGEVPEFGYRFADDISYKISLTLDGKIDGLIDCGKEKFMLPNIDSPRTTKSYELDVRGKYIFGLSYKEKKLCSSQTKQGVPFESFKNINLDFIKDIDSPVVNAFRAFLNTWNPENEIDNKYLLALKNDISKKFVFCLSGNSDSLLHEDPSIRQKWDEKNQLANDAVKAQCAVYGREKSIARIHGIIKGILNDERKLVSYNNDSMCSYGNEQSFNSNISQEAMEKYTTALNMLLAVRNHKSTLDDITVVHWASSGEKQYDDFFEALAMGNIVDDSDEQVQLLLKLIMSNAAKGIVTDELLSSKNNIDPNVDFYIVGLKPNKGRVSVKFIYRKRFGEILQNFADFQNDLAMKENGRPISFWQIKKELIPPKSKDNVNPALMSKLLDSVVYSRNFPQSLLSTVIWRVKADSDEEKNQFIKLNDVRMGIIKGCINRKARLAGKKEEIKMALDKENENAAYLCGRLFAVLEAIQQKASNYSLNRTIKDAYFSSASSKPATVFPNLMRLSQYHLSKIGDPVYFNNDIKEIMDKLPSEFPQSLPLDEQGKFMIGYYHQRSYSDTKRKEAKAAKEEN